jgi:hypothetical protein
MTGRLSDPPAMNVAKANPADTPRIRKRAVLSIGNAVHGDSLIPSKIPRFTAGEVKISEVDWAALRGDRPLRRTPRMSRMRRELRLSPLIAAISSKNLSLRIRWFAA